MERWVVVTTEKRGVFGGLLESNENGAAVLTDARMCVYWSRETRGVLGLASGGPAAGSRISGAVPRAELEGVTAILDATPEARAAWEAGPWSS